MPLMRSSTAARMPSHGLGSDMTGRSELNATGTPALISGPCAARFQRSWAPNGEDGSCANRAAITEALDGAGSQHRPPKSGAHAQARSRLQQLPRQKLVDTDLQPPLFGEPLVGAEVVRKPTVHCGADRGDAAREEQPLGLEDAL